MQKYKYFSGFCRLVSCKVHHYSRMCAAVKYLPGDVVWVKVPRYPWWPAEVVAQQDCKIPNNGKKDPIAYITFPCEDAYDIIRSESNIMPFDSENKKNFIKKGENLPKDLKERFLLALRTSQKTLKKSQATGSKSSSSSSNCDDAFPNLSGNSESPFSTRHFPSHEPTFLQETPTSISTNTSSATTATASILGSKSITGNYTNEISDHLQYSCGQCNFTTSRLNLMLIHYKPEENVLRCPNLPESIVLNAESRKRRLAESDAYLRNQQFKTSRKASPAEPAGRVPCYARIPASPTSHKSVPLGQQSKDNNEESVENLKDVETVSETDKSGVCQERQVNSALNTDNKVAYSDDSSCSTDDEVAGLSAMKSDLPVVENDTVWVKFNKYPFWPALISKVYTKKHHIYRLSVRFFGEILAKETLDFGISYSKDTVISFNDLRKEEFIKQGQESEWKEKFEDALQKVNDYMNKKDDGELTPISDEQYLCKSNSSSPDPSHSEKNDVESTTNESSWYPVQNVNIVEESQTVDMVTSDLVEPTEDVCQTVLELENSESSKEFSAPTVSVMPEIWIPSVDETIGSEVVLHDIDQDVLYKSRLY
ncbi:unnamed protein product [Acanthosepion pharaonis]|uniref:PWWP domain-containing protein n=1 Tax=Acanthosepion pharaonis TaxID=158019 RepID=A0A812CLL8_ACAPH|nr:unnamed protein product [Sepia pharaonis]